METRRLPAKLTLMTYWGDYMGKLKDSGERRQFDSGAVRDISEGKGRCDLLPLSVIGKHFKSRVLELIGGYVETGDIEFLVSAIYDFSMFYYDNCPATAFLEVAKQYEDGMQKYGDRNWEKGIPIHCYIDSGVRHYLKVIRRDEDEDHKRAFMWNMLGAIWTHEHFPELRDLPFNNDQSS